MVAQGRSEEGTGEAQCSWSPWFSMQFGPNYGVLRQEMAKGQALIGAAPPLASPLSLPFDNNIVILTCRPCLILIAGRTQQLEVLILGHQHYL